MNQAFLMLAAEINERPDYISAPRGFETREILGVTVEVDDPFDRLVTTAHRRLSLKYLVGEWLWYERGSNSVEEIAYYSKFWKSLSDDGATANSAYGYRIFGVHPLVRVNQWEYVKKALRDDPHSRRAVLLIGAQSDMVPESRDVPCTISLQFMIRNRRLHLIAFLRSNDLILGFVYDAACFTLFQEKMLLELREFAPDLEMGTYVHCAASMHVYRWHDGMLEAILREPNATHGAPMPRMRDLGDLRKLQWNEAVLRTGGGEKLLDLSDEFCLWCQSQLMR